MRRLMLGIAVAVTSLLPSLGMADDQQIADYIKSRLQAEQSAGKLKGFNVDMRVEQGTVVFKGYVSNPAQEMTILRTAQAAGHLGVVKVVDDISVSAAAPQPSPYVQAGYQQPQMAPTKSPSPASTQKTPFMQTSAPKTYGTGAASGIVVSGEPLPFATSNMSQMAPAMPASYAGSTGPAAEAPNLPGYAWPGYAAYPNYGALAYPQQYSASAWPYIGPFYPYPQVPLGWRKVSLEWDDGWWMLDFHDK